MWEALSPDPVLTQYETDYRWLARCYESLKPSTGTGGLLWHRLGAKDHRTHPRERSCGRRRDDLDTLVLDAELLEAVLGNPDPEKKAKEISIKLTGRLRKHAGNPKFKALSERLEDLKNRHQQGLLLHRLPQGVARSGERRRQNGARDSPEEDLDRGKAALTHCLRKRTITPRSWFSVLSTTSTKLLGRSVSTAGKRRSRAKGRSRRHSARRCSGTSFIKTQISLIERTAT